MSILGTAAKLGMALAMTVALGACALTRSEVAVAQNVAPDPASGVVVVIESVFDQREFSDAPGYPSMPSLKESSQLNDKQITSRAIGRKRNTVGGALGDVLLSPPQTVASLVGDAVKSGLRDAGYRVVDASDPANARAPRITVRVIEFWNWVTPGMSTIKLDHASRIVLEGGLPALRQPVIITAEGREGYFAISESVWAPFVLQRLSELRQKVRDAVAPRTS
jgi:hypothetical protein